MIELIFKKNRIPYCKYCTHYIRYFSLFDTDNESLYKPDNGRDICRESFTYKKNVMGNIRMAVYPKDEHCETCGRITGKAGRIRYEKCEVKNRTLECKSFNPRWYAKLFFRGK